MKLWLLTFLASISCLAQNSLIKNVDSFIGADIHENIYYTQNNTLYKNSTTNNYINIDYGSPDVIDISNPLQILILYKLFNKIVLLDNQLSFIAEFNVPFGTELISNAGKNKIWIYDNINMIIKLYNFNTQKTEIKSNPVKNNIVKLHGNLSQAIVINNKNMLIKYNYLARPEEKIDGTNKVFQQSLIKDYFIKNNKLYHKDNILLDVPDKIKSFEVVNDKIYFFKENKIYTLSIPKN